MIRKVWRRMTGTWPVEEWTRTDPFSTDDTGKRRRARTAVMAGEAGSSQAECENSIGLLIVSRQPENYAHNWQNIDLHQCWQWEQNENILHLYTVTLASCTTGYFARGSTKFLELSFILADIKWKLFSRHQPSFLKRNESCENCTVFLMTPLLDLTK
jgi:hypothetical protein